MDSLSQDLRFAARSFLRVPRFIVPAILALALGIGATAAMFSVVRGVLLEPLPYPNPDRVVVVWEHNIKRNRSRNVISAANFLAWRERSRSFEHIAMVGPARQNVMTSGQPEEARGIFASSAIFPVLGVQPRLGRAYTAFEDLKGNDRVVVLGYEYWHGRFNARTDLLGSSMLMNGVPTTIIGVMPAGFTIIGRNIDFLIPYGWSEEELRQAQGRGSSFGIARLRDGISFEQASAEMKGIAAQLAKEEPQRDAGWSVNLVRVHDQLVDQIRPALLVLVGAVLMVLLIACVNVANLQLARSTGRQRELGLRSALGAGRGRLMRQLLTENLLLAGVGGIAGLAMAVGFHSGLRALVSDRIPVPRLEDIQLDGYVVAATIFLSIFSGLLFGILPAITASSTLSEAFREGGRHSGGPRSRRILGGLVVAEIALSLVLLAGAGLLIRSLARLQEINPGFRSDHLLTARIQLPPARYSDPVRTSDFFDRAIERVERLPGTQAAAGISYLPLAGPGIGTSFYVEGQPRPAPGEFPIAEVRPITTGFFRTMGIPFLTGRDIALADRGERPDVAVINETMARGHLSGEDPLGRRLNVSLDGFRQFEVIGVVGDIKLASLEGDVRPTIYVPHTQLSIGMMTLVVRTKQDPLTLANSVGAAVRAIDPEQPLADVRTMEDVVAGTLARPRAIAVLLATFAVLALVLAGVGVYGVMAYSVSQRTQEFGVRMALGATRASVFRLVLGYSLRLVAVGIGAGVLAASGLTRTLSTLLYDTEPLDLWTFGTTALILIMVAMVACFVPAHRGTRVAPMDALRTE
jgi:putative ABC transport system permease protein